MKVEMISTEKWEVEVTDRNKILGNYENFYETFQERILRKNLCDKKSYGERCMDTAQKMKFSIKNFSFFCAVVMVDKGILVMKCVPEFSEVFWYDAN